MKTRNKIAVGVAGTVVLFTGISLASGGGNTPDSAPTHKVATVNERADLKSFKLDDRSAYGVTDIWVNFTLTNHSSHKSNYTFDWEAVNSKGVRVDSGSEFVTNVRPGQTVKGDDFTTLHNTGVTLNVTSFNRTESY